MSNITKNDIQDNTTSINNNKIDYIKTLIKLDDSRFGKKIDLGIKNHIFIGYDHTENIKNYIINENWGIFNKRLFYYLNYTFRARVLTNEIFKYKFNNDIIIGLFHSGLKSKINNNDLYLIFTPNQEIRKQQWTLPIDGSKIEDYLMSKEMLIKKFGIKECDIPEMPKYFGKNYKFYPNWQLYLDWDQDLRLLLNHKTGGNSKQVILGEFSKNGIKLDSNRMRQILIHPLRMAVMKAKNEYINDNSYIRPGIFFNKDNFKIVQQMLLNVEYPVNSGKITKFVAVFEEMPNQKSYKFRKLLNLEMASKNARLVDKLPESWKFIENNININNDNINDIKPNKISLDSIKKKLPKIIIPNLNINNNNNNINNINNNKLIKDEFKIDTNTLLNISPNYTPSSLLSTTNSFTKMNINNISPILPMPTPNSINLSNISPTLSIPTPTPNITPPTTSNNNINNDPYNILSTTMLNISEYPKHFKAYKERKLQLNIINNTIIEIFNEEIIETSLLNSIPIKSSKTIIHKLTDLKDNILNELKISPILLIQSQHEIDQININNNIESVIELHTLQNGNQFKTFKTYCNSIDINGKIISSEFKPLNNNNNNNYTGINYNYNNINNNTMNMNNIKLNNFSLNNFSNIYQ